MKKFTTMLFSIMALCIAAGCGGGYALESDFEELEVVDLNSVEELYRIRITADNTILSGVLYDTDTARAFAEMLPLTVNLWHPAPDFARAFDLPESIPRYERPGYEYEPGSLAYWYEGPSIAAIYKASRDQTVVPVVPIGRITSDTSIFEEYGSTITIELEENEDESMTEKKG